MKLLKRISILLMYFVIMLIASCDKKSVEPSIPAEDPILQVSATSMKLAGGPMFDVITIYGTGGGFNNQWRITSSPSWLSAQPMSGFFFTDSVQIRLTTIFDALEYGDYEDVIKVESTFGNAEIVVSLHYTPPQLELGTLVLNLDRHYSEGNFIIENSGGGGLEWVITESPNWLEFDSVIDTVYGPYQAVPFRVKFETIGYGDYEADIKIESNGGNAQLKSYLSYFREEEVYPGVGAAAIELGYSYDRVKQIWGTPDRNWYERPEKTVFIHYFTYEKLGLLFSVQNSSLILYGSGAVGYIHLSAPYDGLTVEKRIGIGSSLADLLTAYGDPTTLADDLYYYDIGITFEVKSDAVAAMIIK